ncbi:cytochrome P450/NADPH-cytochrome P450 reductase [Cohnella sp. SGD-V74]|uniref:bifunctional cytochrome P450/NADPH--P450 reductase n=1 Tax=unclassified Cohnella TaxID=2636738 RepID=UPI000B8C1053|nr:MULTISPECIES: cytochrome P450 [unclassified Cohnella]PRX70698.1 cytochrome P450/NADPH-cytochrome P450 reductase [Cohnella sp. SGD-V74]
MKTGYVPEPKSYGLLGHLSLIDKEKPTLSMCKLAEELGPIYRLRGPGFSMLVVSGHKLAAEVCDVSRFDKNVYGELQNVRAFSGDGLFTSWTHEPNWRKAHNILLPTFSQQAMKGYHDMMTDIALQLVQKWARLNSDESIDVADDMTRLTLDTIGLCGFNYRFNSFYKESHSPFIVSMVRALNEAMNRSGRLGIQNFFMVKTKRQFQEDIATMFELVDKIIAERKAKGSQGDLDLLARMLSGKDPQTGETLDDENIRYQIITFLIAGHETTSGLLSFALYFLLKNPSALKNACEEVDRVLTGSIPTHKQVTQLKYIRMILNESLRLWPTAPGFDLYAKEDTVIGGQYPMKKGDTVSVLLPQLHRDKEAWGEDADSFRPERFEDPSKVPNHAYKPFGNGERACIGMQFALYEATLVLGMIVRHFELIDHRDYQLDVKQTLTIKPGDFTMRVRLRPGRQVSAASAAPAAAEEIAGQQEERQPLAPTAMPGAEKTSLLVLYGSNLGTAEGIARAAADSARAFGMKGEVAPLNDWAGKLPTDGAVLIVTASYNGKPPQNAAGFVKWLEQAKPGELEGVRYAVLGCGDRNWSNTYQSVPRYIDELLERKGGRRISARAEADAGGDMEKQLGQWRRALWADIGKTFELNVGGDEGREGPALGVRFVNAPPDVPFARTYGAAYADVRDNCELQSEGSGRSTRHLEIAVPAGTAYREGDHLGVLPVNGKDNVDRVIRRFRLNASSQLILTAEGSGAAHLPLNRPVNAADLLSHCVELQEPATRAQLREMAAYTVCPPHKRELESCLEEAAYEERILNPRVSMLDLLDKYEACELPFEKFLELLPPLKPRYYSISSSPRVQPERLSVTVAVVREPARSGLGEYRGVASTYLAGRQAGDDVLVFVRSPESGFRLPEDPAAPIVMVGPGTGVAPFRGFLQARAELKKQGAGLGEAHLFFGCRSEADHLYREELEQYEKERIVTLHTAYSRMEGKSKTYVQHLLSRNASEIIRLLSGQGHLYLCGDGVRMAPDVEAALMQAYRDERGATPQEAADWLLALEHEGRYAKDVWVGK